MQSSYLSHSVHSHLAFASAFRHLIGKTKLDSLIGKHPRFRFQQLSGSSPLSPRSLGADRRDALLDFIERLWLSMSSTVPAA